MQEWGEYFSQKNHSKGQNAPNYFSLGWSGFFFFFKYYVLKCLNLEVLINFEFEYDNSALINYNAFKETYFIYSVLLLRKVNQIQTIKEKFECLKP